MVTLKPKNSKLITFTAVHCARGFLYILGDSGPWCGPPGSSSDSPVYLGSSHGSNDQDGSAEGEKVAGNRALALSVQSPSVQTVQNS